MQRPVTLYVAHGGLVTVRSLASNAQRFDETKNELQIMVIYDKGSYIIKNVDALASVLNTYDIDVSSAALAEDVFFKLIDEIEALDIVDRNKKRLCCDANFSDIGGAYVTQKVHTFISLWRPQSVILFTDTTDCVKDAQAYLEGKTSLKGFTLPEFVVSGCVSTRKDLRECFEHEVKNPTLIGPITRFVVTEMSVREDRPPERKVRHPYVDPHLMRRFVKIAPEQEVEKNLSAHDGTLSTGRNRLMRYCCFFAKFQPRLTSSQNSSPAGARVIEENKIRLVSVQGK